LKRLIDKAHPMISMFSTWRVKDFDVGTAAASHIAAESLDAADWIDVPIPGDLYLALHAAGRLPDPFGDRTESECAWVKDREWWWCADFDAPAIATNQRLILTFEGLDTFATVWLNGKSLASTDNMFRAWSFDIGEHTRPGSNALLVSFTPTSTAIVDKAMPVWSIISDPIEETKRNFIRKAQFGWGWDWGPRLPTVGIWKPVTLQLETDAAIEAIKFTTQDISEARDHAKVSVELSIDAFSNAASLSAGIVLRDPQGVVVYQRTLGLSGAKASIELNIDDPQLWWTPELGAASLYALNVVLKADERIIDFRDMKVGIRTIAIDTSSDADEPGASFFRFVVNGVPIFARGVCWVPASSFVGAVDEPHYRHLLRMAADANMNMIRVWGGGVYEHDAFYDVCDELGLLVWQDFMFACAPYPEHEPAFVENVRAEVRHQIERLRHHASLAVWCGNNEGQAVQGFMNRMTGGNEPLAGALYYDKVMPEALAELDPTTPYWPGSPTGGPSDNSMLAGDVHHWTVWHGLPLVPIDEPVGSFDHSPEGVAYTRYAEDNARFISEYGIQASPGMPTLQRALPEDQRVLGSEGLLNRIKDKPKDKVDAMLIPVTGLPTTLEEYVDFTQITQAEGLKFGIEHFRRRKPHCSGSLIWQYNDCWPGISWSLVDYYGFGKAAYYYTSRAYAPVLASFKSLDDGGVELWITNDTLDTLRGEAIVELGTFDGDTIWSVPWAYDVEPNGSKPVWQASAVQLGSSASRFLTVSSSNDVFETNRCFFAAIKDLDRPKGKLPEVEIEVVSAHELHVHLATATYLYFVHITTPHGWTYFSDNYFDMRCGETRTIIVRNPGMEISPQDVQIASC
jgi:beta-mannosidase